MKKWIIFIILLVLWISSANWAWFKDSLNLTIWTEIYDINQYSLDEYNFNNVHLRNTYNEIVYFDSAFREEIFKRFRDWKIKRYQANGIVKEYKNFIYYSNQFFYYIKQSEYWNSNSEYSYYIWRNYKDLTASYQRMANIIK